MDLRTIPGVGQTTKRDFYELGIYDVESLVGKDPETLYQQHCKQKGCTVDRCQLYVFRCAVYFAEHPDCDPKTLHWWDFKDTKGGENGCQIG